MRICAFADIHGNWPAFQAALPMILSEGADLNICLGDVCGYYKDAPKVVSALLDIPRLAAVRGNHDDMFLRAADGDHALQKAYAEKYGPALEAFLREGHKETMAWLRRTPLTHSDQANRLFCCHGGPRDPLEEYIYPTDPDDRFSGVDADWCLFGHTHYAMRRRSGSVRAINPGSVGQPRDGGWPQFAVIDTKADRVDFKEFRFDKERFSAEARAWAQERPYLADIWGRIKT